MASHTSLISLTRTFGILSTVLIFSKPVKLPVCTVLTIHLSLSLLPLFSPIHKASLSRPSYSTLAPYTFHSFASFFQLSSPLLGLSNTATKYLNWEVCFSCFPFTFTSYPYPYSPHNTPTYFYLHSPSVPLFCILKKSGYHQSWILFGFTMKCHIFCINFQSNLYDPIFTYFLTITPKTPRGHDTLSFKRLNFIPLL